jgi:hypothetical protein
MVMPVGGLHPGIGTMTVTVAEAVFVPPAPVAVAV